MSFNKLTKRLANAYKGEYGLGICVPVRLSGWSICMSGWMLDFTTGWTWGWWLVYANSTFCFLVRVCDKCMNLAGTIGEDHVDGLGSDISSFRWNISRFFFLVDGYGLESWPWECRGCLRIFKWWLRTLKTKVSHVWFHSLSWSRIRSFMMLWWYSLFFGWRVLFWTKLDIFLRLRRKKNGKFRYF